MQKTIGISVCLCAFAGGAWAGNHGYLTGGPAGQLSAGTAPIEVGPRKAKKKTEGLVAGIKKMDDWIQKNLW